MQENHFTFSENTGLGTPANFMTNTKFPKLNSCYGKTFKKLFR